PADLAPKARRVEGEVYERRVLHLVLPAHLLDEELRVRDDLDLVDSELEGLGESGDQCPVFGNVVRRDADRLAASVEHGAVLRLEDVGGGSRTRVSARDSVRVEPRLYTCGTTSHTGTRIVLVLRS